MRSNSKAMVTLKSRRVLNPHPSHSMQRELLKSQEVKKPHARRHGRRNRQEEVCTHPTADENQNDGCENIADELFDGHGDTVDEG